MAGSPPVIYHQHYYSTASLRLPSHGQCITTQVFTANSASGTSGFWHIFHMCLTARCTGDIGSNGAGKGGGIGSAGELRYHIHQQCLEGRGRCSCAISVWMMREMTSTAWPAVFGWWWAGEGSGWNVLFLLPLLLLTYLFSERHAPTCTSHPAKPINWNLIKH